MKYYISQSPANPLMRIVAALIATICLLGAFFFGLVILAVIAFFIAGLSLVFWLRAWWSGRNSPSPVPRPNTNQAGPQRDGQGQEIIEGEYTVISERRD